MEESWTPLAKVYEPIAVGSIDGSDKQPHDRAVIRAIENKFVPNSKLKGDPNCTIFIGRLHPEVSEIELRKCFIEYGTINSCVVVRDIVTQNSKQYGFVEYEKPRYAERAYRNGHRKLIRGAEVLVDWELGRTLPGWKPRSLGGGFGGRKESGQLRFGCRDRPWNKPIVLYKDKYTDHRTFHHQSGT